MIPGTALPSNRLSLDDALHPLQSVKALPALTDVLSDVTPGQRLVAVIQGQLPNGTYRALIAQRDVTLALPFAAKSGDSLELVVVDTDGRLTLAVTSQPDQANAPKESVTTTLSRTGQLIGELFAGKGNAGEIPPAVLNGGKAIAPTPPHAGPELSPLLQKALTESGVFYESHQRSWLEGTVTREALLTEPQGRLSPAPPIPNPGAQPASIPAGGASPAATAAHDHATGVHPDAPVALAGKAAEMTSSSQAALPEASQLPSSPATSVADARAWSNSAPSGGSITPELAPLVQQQLNALGTNVYAWQGIAWPGQTIQWEIVDEDGKRPPGSQPDDTAPWETRLRLSMPSLGALDARVRLRGNEVDILLTARTDESRRILTAGGDALRRQFDAAGLRLAALGVDNGSGDDA